jgi:hypothetical protein
VLAKFHKPLTKWLQEVLPVLGNDPLAQLNIHCSNGRISSVDADTAFRPIAIRNGDSSPA